jgi:hypothetical protein
MSADHQWITALLESRAGAQRSRTVEFAGRLQRPGPRKPPGGILVARLLLATSFRTWLRGAWPPSRPLEEE